MIHQFVELGRYYHRKAGIGSDDAGLLRQYAQDPAKKFKTSNVVVLCFGTSGFSGVRVEEYDDGKRLRYLYRFGSAAGGDITATTGLRVEPAFPHEFDDLVRTEIGKKLTRIRGAISRARDVVRQPTPELEELESNALGTMYDCLEPAMTPKIVDALFMSFPPENRKLKRALPPAILTVAWKSDKGEQYVGDLVSFQRLILEAGQSTASTMSSISATPIRGRATCSVCGAAAEVSGASRIGQFKFYSIDDVGNVSGGFDQSLAWRNYPVCDECAQMSDFAGEPVKAGLTYSYYGKLRYTVLPSPVIGEPSDVYDSLDRLVDMRFTRAAKKRLTDTEDELFYVIANESNRLQVDLLFFEPDPQSFQPSLYVSGLLPSRFGELFRIKDEVDSHPWRTKPSPKPFDQEFTFGALYEVLRGSQRMFLAATRAALELRPLDRPELVRSGMRRASEDYRQAKDWMESLANLFRTLAFFECIAGGHMSTTDDVVNYGDSEQAQRVRELFNQGGDRLRGSAAAQAAFLVGACCSRIEVLQQHQRGSAPFAGKLKGFRLTKADVDRLFVAAKEKAAAYGEDEERKVSGLLECAAAALITADMSTPGLSNEEISYFVALGHALRPRLAK